MKYKLNNLGSFEFLNKMTPMYEAVITEILDTIYPKLSEYTKRLSEKFHDQFVYDVNKVFWNVSDKHGAAVKIVWTGTKGSGDKFVPTFSIIIKDVNSYDDKYNVYVHLINRNGRIIIDQNIKQYFKVAQLANPDNILKVFQDYNLKVEEFDFDLDNWARMSSVNEDAKTPEELQGKFIAGIYPHVMRGVWSKEKGTELGGEFEDVDTEADLKDDDSIISYTGTKNPEDLGKRLKKELNDKEFLYLKKERLGESIAPFEITIDDVVKMLDETPPYMRSADGERITLTTIENFYYSENEKERKEAIWTLEQSNIALKKVLSILNQHGVKYVNQKDLMRRITLSYEPANERFPVPVEVSATSDMHKGIGILVHLNGKMEMFEGNDESDGATYELVNKLLGLDKKKVTVWGSHTQDIIDKMMETKKIPAGIYVSPNRNHAASYWGKDRSLFSCEISLGDVHQESELDWKVSKDGAVINKVKTF